MLQYSVRAGAAQSADGSGWSSGCSVIIIFNMIIMINYYYYYDDDDDHYLFTVIFPYSAARFVTPSAGRTISTSHQICGVRRSEAVHAVGGHDRATRLVLHATHLCGCRELIHTHHPSHPNIMTSVSLFTSSTIHPHLPYLRPSPVSVGPGGR